MCVCVCVCDTVRSSGTSAFKKALEESGSQSQEEFLLQFNVDILTPELRHAEDEVSGIVS